MVALKKEELARLLLGEKEKQERRGGIENGTRCKSRGGSCREAGTPWWH